MEKKSNIDEPFDEIYKSVARKKDKSHIDECSDETYKPVASKKGWSHIDESSDETSKTVAHKKSWSHIPYSFDEIYKSMTCEKPFHSWLSDVSFEQLCRLGSDNSEYPPQLDMDHLEYPPQPDMSNDFTGSHIAMQDGLTQAKSHPFQTIIEPRAFYAHFEKTAYCLVKTFLADLVEGLSNQNFQVELQKLLMSSRTRQTPTGAKGKKTVPGRCALSQMVEEKALVKIGFAETATVRAWKLVSFFLCEERVRDHLSLIDDLLFLPPSSQFTAVRHCGDQ